MSTRKSAFDFFFFKILSGSKMLLFQELRCVTTVIPWLSFWRLRLFKGRLCHVQLRNRIVTQPSPSGRVQCFTMAKIDPVSPFYPTLWLEKGILQWRNLQEVQKNEPWAVNIYFCAFRNWKCWHNITAGLSWKFLQSLHSIIHASSQVCFKWMSKCVI